MLIYSSPPDISGVRQYIEARQWSPCAWNAAAGWECHWLVWQSFHGFTKSLLLSKTDMYFGHCEASSKMYFAISWHPVYLHRVVVQMNLIMAPSITLDYDAVMEARYFLFETFFKSVLIPHQQLSYMTMHCQKATSSYLGTRHPDPQNCLKH